VIAPEDRQPIVVADAGPLIRLAAAGLLGSLRGLNRRIVLVDGIADEVVGDSSKPYAREMANWIAEMGDAILCAQTVTGVVLTPCAGVAELQTKIVSSNRRCGILASLHCENSSKLGDQWTFPPPSSYMRIGKLPHSFLRRIFR
jgi:hypothetical protein